VSFHWQGQLLFLKKFSLHKLVESTQPNLILLQETLGEAASIITFLESFLKHWKFIGVYAKGRSRGLAIGWNTRSVKILNSWGFDLGLGINIFQEDLGRCFMVLNVYGPNQDHVLFWDNLLNKSFLSNDDLILGGDLNFLVGVVESWGPRARLIPSQTTLVTSKVKRD
jgi:hypothetical protein